MNAYKILNIDENATIKEIKQAFLQKIRTHHPDKDGDKEQARILIDAYKQLLDKQYKANPYIFKEYGVYGTQFEFICEQCGDENKIIQQNVGAVI
ncbi:hypothetical protein pb186bvf_006288 [Paramecium bursaria]